MTLRRLLMASVFALGFSVATPAPAKADPISAAIITTLGFTATASAVAATTTFLINAGLYAATSLATRAMGKRKASVQERQAAVTSLSLGEVPREAVFGEPAIGGSLVDVWNWGGQYGTDNVTRCIALADHAVVQLRGYYVDDIYYPFTGNGVQPGFGGTLTIEFRNATADGHAPPSYAAANGWASTDRMTAVTHVWVTTRFDEKVWTQGHPKFRWVMQGLACFDPRYGDVWEDRSTHSYTRNPAIIRYALARGIYAEGHQGEAEHLLVGRGLSPIEAPPERIIAAANLCDESVEGISRYYVDGSVTADMDFITVEQLFADSMAGHIIQHEGGVEVEPGQAKAAVVTITDGDLVVGEPVTFSHFLPDSDGGRINTVVPRFVDPATFTDRSGPVRRDLADIAEDGGPREMTLSLPFVTGAAVADRNAEIARRLARLERRATIVLPPEFAWLEEGDWIAWQSNRRHDGATVRYRIESWSLDAAWRMRLSLREIASSVYGVPDPIEDEVVPPAPPVPIDALSLLGVQAEAVTLAGETAVQPAIRVMWSTPVDAALRGIRAEVRATGETEASPTSITDIAAGVAVITNGVAANASLQVRLVPIGEPTRPVLPSVWLTVQTGSLIADDIGPGGRETLLNQLRATLAETSDAEALAEVVLETILNEQENLEAEARQRVADVRAEREARGENIAEVRQEITTVNDGVVASIERIDQDIAATENGIALAEERSRVYADDIYSEVQVNFTTTAAFNDGLATTLSASQSYTDALEARAEQTFATTAALNNGLAGTLIQSQAQVDAYAATASQTFSTIAALNGGLAATLSEAQSYTNGQISTALNTVYTKAQVDASLATTLQQAQSYADAELAEASLTFATTSSLNGVSSTATLALTTAQTAIGRGDAAFTLALDVNGYVSGFTSQNTGSFSTFYILADALGIVSPGGGDRFEYYSGIIYIYPADGSSRTMIGKPFGASGHGLIIWNGPNSTPLGQETKANAYVYVSTNTVGGPRFGGSSTPAGAAYNVDNPTPSRIGTRSGAGSVTSNTATLTPTNNTCTVSYSWTRIFGDTSVTATSPTGQATAFSATLAAGEQKQALFVWRATDSGTGITREGQVGVGLISNV